jgi:radical SAM superfamily enzyme YgiQ (UPF0313 family)
VRVLLVHPRFPPTYWGYQYALPLIKKRAALPPLGLATLAALFPPRFEVRLVDEEVVPMCDADLAWADVVLVGGMRVQAPGIQDVLARAKKAGCRTVVGGPAATATPEEFVAADHVFVGEAEGRADVIAQALERPGSLPRMLTEPGGRSRPEMSKSPIPRFDLIQHREYSSMSLQYSRGCPYGCEFCDVIEMFGRKPRVKSIEQVLAELDAINRTGYRGSVFFVDDNFIGNKPHVKKLLPRLQRWQEEHGRPFEFYTEASVNLASDPQLVRQMVEAGFTTVFLGIETPSTAALREAGKTQNLRLDLHEAVDSLTRDGLEVLGGFIVGFDEDDETAFQAQLDFISSSPIPLAMVGLLNALPGTKLWKRLEREGRLHDRASGDQFCRPNFEPAMGEKTLLSGYARLLGSLYSDDGYARRCRLFLESVACSGASSCARCSAARVWCRARSRSSSWVST